MPSIPPNTRAEPLTIAIFLRVSENQQVIEGIKFVNQETAKS